MRYYILIFSILFMLFSCEEKKGVSSMNPVSWEKRNIDSRNLDSLFKGASYLSVYSDIYDGSEHRKYGLTATVSLRNVSPTDSVYILRADYYDTHGDRIRTYFDKPIYIKPLETVEIVIDEIDKDGGTGANFIFKWASPKKSLEPHFEAVMISTTGQQGISFTTQGIKI